jgi:energy-coupling factor transport system permease protein
VAVPSVGSAVQSVSASPANAAGEVAQSAAPADLDVRAWLLWVLTGLVIALGTSNPWYLLLIVSLVCALWPRRAGANAEGLLTLRGSLRLAVYALLFGAAFNALIVRVGPSVLLRLPDWLPVLGGAFTVEAALYGALSALRFVTILFLFALFSRVVRAADLLRLAPSAFFELGLVVSIGLHLAPATLRAHREISEAQALRGHQPRGIRDLPPLLTPLVAGGLERALHLAEALEARGYGAQADERTARQAGWLALLGIVIGGAALAAQSGSLLPGAVQAALYGLAGLLVARAMRLLSRRGGRTSLRRGRWGAAEMLVGGGALAALLVVLAAGPIAMSYDAYRVAAVGLPPFNPWIGAALLLLALPGLVSRRL